MSRTAWIVVIALGVVGLGVVIYFATRPAAPADSGNGGGDSDTDTAGIIGGIGMGLTSIATSIGQAVSMSDREEEDEGNVNGNGVMIAILVGAVAVLGTLYFVGMRDRERLRGNRLMDADRAVSTSINTAPTLTTARPSQPLVPVFSASPAQQQVAAEIVAIR